MKIKNFRFFALIALIALMASLMFPSIAWADDGTAPSPAVPATGASSSTGINPASTDAPAAQPAATQAPVSAPSTDVSAAQPAATQAPVSVPSTDVPATQPAATQAPVDASSTDIATQPAATQAPSTDLSGDKATASSNEAGAVAALANSSSVLTDQNGNTIPLASAQAAAILGQSAPDPVVCPAGSKNASAPGCVPGYTKISDAIAAASAGSVIFVGSGTYKEQISIDKSLDLIGDGSATTIIQAPAALTSDAEGYKSLIEITGAATVVDISGFTITGQGPLAAVASTMAFMCAAVPPPISAITLLRISAINRLAVVRMALPFVLARKHSVRLERQRLRTIPLAIIKRAAS